MAFIKEFVAWIKRILNKLIPTSWDYRFSKINEAEWVRVTLKDGTKIAGYFGANSFASSVESERDLYIEEMYYTDICESWERLIPSRGILIKGEEIKYIEFLGNTQKVVDV